MRLNTRYLLVLLLCACGGPLFASEDSRMVLSGDVSAIYKAGDFLLWTPKERKERTGGATMSAATSMTSASGSRPSVEDSVNVIAKAPLDAEGRFTLSVDVAEPKVVFFYVINGLGHEGQRFAPTKGQSFIMEAGELHLRIQSSHPRFIIEGGFYNDAVYNSWKLSEAFLETASTMHRLNKPVEGESETERRSRVDGAAEAASRMYELETEGRSEVATTHPDPMVRRLVIESAWLHGPWLLEAVRGLAEMVPDDPWAQARLEREEAFAEKRAAARRISTGTEILDFTAETLDGESVRLADVRADSRYVLLEFWASWCGPCRVEIPHMKEAYATHKPSGFEIVSFTIDNDREDWELASDEEDIPWLNLGMGEDADAPKAYSVYGVPKNYLVESNTGEILATDLRGHHLDEKLKELLGG